ncbi:aldo/keto reductase [Acetobacter sp. UBA5411]|uniref:aldo/keto reductase n=1 Tax=Acetobacter sp. UBA5411 TaxID=1945905 RepID=UPI0025BE3D49|nr:aldo/keto reductase [Acetobacter sp. UBA5411]
MTRKVRFKNGVEVPALGMGTWNMGDDVSLRSDEIASLQAGLDAGLRVIDTADMKEVEQTSQGESCVANQVLYSLSHRGIEFDLLAEDHDRQVVTMAYSPLGQGGGMLKDNVLAKIAQKHSTSLGPAKPAQIALAWVLRQSSLIAIPKAGSKKHLLENIAAQEIRLTDDDLAALDKAFPPPKKKVPLEVI